MTTMTTPIDNEGLDQEVDDWIEEALSRGEGFKSDEERKAYLDSLGDPMSHPMFAQTTEDMKGHPLTEAFRALQEEDKSPIELANMYKGEGNDFMKKSKTAKDMNEAYDRYSYALTFIDKAYEARQNHTEDSKDVGYDIDQLKSIILSNRAQASLTIKNYRYCITDCEEAMKSSRNNIKAYYRKAKALNQLKKFDESLLCCEEGLTVDRESKELQELLLTNRKELETRQKLISDKNDLVFKQEQNWLAAWNLIQSLRENIVFGYPLSPTNPFSFLKANLLPHRDETEEEANSVRWSIVFLYVQYGEYDIVQSVGSNDMLVSHLAVIFPEEDEALPAPWDKHHEYRISNLIAYLPLELYPKIVDREAWKSCFYELRSVTGEDNSPDLVTRYNDRVKDYEREYRLRSNTVLEIHPGCSIFTIAKTPGHVLGGGVINILVFPRGNDAHKQYLEIQKKMGTKFKRLEPDGTIN